MAWRFFTAGGVAKTGEYVELATPSGNPTLVTSLPGSPTDGQEVYYQADDANGLIWHLRFRSTASGGNATYPWEFVGGSRLSSTAAGGFTTTAASWGDLVSGTAPNFSLPLAGDYHLTYGEWSIGSPGGPREFNIAPTATGLTAGTSGTTSRILSGGNDEAGAHFEYRAVGISGTLKIQFLSATYATTHTLMYLTATPIRVG